jgi:signal transduction histidine kinase
MAGRSSRRHRVRFLVEDQAPAVPPERWRCVFEPLACADVRTRREHGGMGLGLAISKRLAELLGGRLEMTSREGVGNTFVLELPG